MEFLEEIKKPSKEEQKAALESYEILTTIIEGLQSENPEIEIQETSQKIKIPLTALRLLATILKETSKGRPVSVVPKATEMTTQAASELLGCSRPHLVKLLEKGELSFTKVGRHRRIKYEDLLEYKKKIKADQKKRLIEIMEADQEEGLYDS